MPSCDFNFYPNFAILQSIRTINGDIDYEDDIDYTFDRMSIEQSQYSSPLTNFSFDANTESWKRKPLEQWKPIDVQFFFAHVTNNERITFADIDVTKFNEVNGEELKSYSKNHFVEKCPDYGALFYEELQKFKNDPKGYLSSGYSPSYNSAFSHFPQINNPSVNNFSDSDNSVQIPETLNDISSYSSQKTNSFINYGSSDSECDPPQKIKRRPGRPRGQGTKRRAKKTGRLWEFIRNMLLNPEHCPSIIQWDNYEQGTFRFVNSDKAAKLWGSIKNNERMNYEKLSRAMRYYYKSHIFEPVLGRRLVYKFGHAATGWETSNPNFGKV